jgi:protease PrsW
MSTASTTPLDKAPEAKEPTTPLEYRPAPPAESSGIWSKVAVVAFAGIALGLIALLLLGSLLMLGPVSFVVAVTMAFVPVPLYAMLVLAADRHEPEPPWALALALLWGGGVAIFGSIIVEIVGGVVVYLAAGEAVADVVGVVAFAPIAEETMKGLGLLVVLLALRRHFDGVVDGIVYGAMIGLGFAAVENITYYGGALRDGGAAGGAVTFVIRGIASPFAHSLFTTMTGIGCGIARERGRGLIAWTAPVLGYCAAVFLHATWNGSLVLIDSLFGEAGLAHFAGTYAFGWVPLFVCALALAGFCLHRERRILRDQLTEEVTLGVLTRAEYDDVVSPSRRFAFKARSLWHGGLKGYSAARAFARTATRLGLSKWHTENARRGRAETRSLTQIPLLRLQLAQQRGSIVR